MSTTTREPQATESYATFWEPASGEASPAPVPGPSAALSLGEAKDAYLEFTNATEEEQAAPHGKPA